MEQVLEVYRRPYDPRFPVVCMDEQPKQLIREVSSPLPPRPGAAACTDHEYIREGVCNLWMFVEPLAGWRDVAVTATKSGRDWAQKIQHLVDLPRYAEAERITLVCDNLSTHALSSLYKTFEPREALRIANRLQLVYTPVHGSWLNIAEIELSAMTRQCLKRRMPTQDGIASETAAWARQRNQSQIGVNWQFNTDDARLRLLRLYPQVISG